MPITYQQSLDAIAQLVKQFNTNRAAYLAPNFKEAQARQALIDPLFIALGWDVHNSEHVAPDYQFVLVEEPNPAHGHQRSPDYTFRTGKHDRKFFAEAKKPGVALKSSAEAGYQLRSYGWNAKLPVSILTDFDEFAVYNCRRKPLPKDKPNVARLHYYTCDEYADRWRELWDVFSLEAVRAGAFDQFARSGQSERGASTVDADFLETIEGWRKALAQNLELRNQLHEDDLTDAVQRTIDRLVFLRIAEDREIEPYEQLAEIGRADGVYRRLVALFRKADRKYNSGLFNFDADKRALRLEVDDRVLRAIIADLYGAYNFRIMPVEILGNVYEQFLGKVIHVTAGGHAKVEEKPEVRKAGGVYYTPSYIVDYIVRSTVGRQVEGKSVKDVAKLRVLDMACGSGSFLLGAYQFLLDWHLRWYLAHAPEKQKKAVYDAGRGARAADWRLTTEEKKRILLANIYGVDIDRQAVEVTKLSLLLKVLEDEKGESGQLALLEQDGERVLPDLDRNILCGNSLIGPDYFGGSLMPDAEALKRVNPFDWQSAFPDVMRAGGFDCVIGNPPYGAFLAEQQSDYLRERFDSASQNLDTYVLFMEQAVRLTKPLGRISMIVPTGWYSGSKHSAIRKLIARTTDPEVFINLPYDVFKAWVDTTIFATVKRPTPTEWPSTEPLIVRLRTFPKRHTIGSWEEFDTDLQSVDFRQWFAKGEDAYLTYADTGTTAVLQKIQDQSRALQEFADVQRGVTPFNLTPKPTHATSRPAFSGTVRRYRLENGPVSYIRFDSTLAEPKPDRYFQGPRLLLRELISRQFQLQAVKVTDDFVTNKSMQSILPLVNGPDLNYLLGLINSRLMAWYFLHQSNVGQRDDFPKIVLKETRSLPIRPIALSDPADKARHDRMVSLVERMLELHKRLRAAGSDSEREVLQRQIDATDRQIDVLVYELYGLTAEEVAAVEG